ncbi:acyltransferase domain-containing protein, partial [Streptomyces sp. NPDC048514]|uniref:acyltransferase domain-containing protein n=1 Tax=Streptomyces sp. NPDC048514 TaxID=3365564 RepID=UPI00371A29EE
GSGVVPLVVSARGVGALRGQAERLGALVGAVPEVCGVGEVGFSLVASRSVFEHRAVVLAGDRGGAVDGLGVLAAGGSGGGVIAGVAGPVGGRVFVFPGQGSQWVGMAVELLDSSPVFAERLAECEGALSPFVDWSLVGVLRGLPGAPSLDRVDVVQPALFAVMVSLAAVWASVGVVPDAVVGHSQGEIAAACVAGALTLEDAARVVTLRSRALGVLAGAGGMVSVALPRESVAARVEAWGGRISIAAVNGPSSVVVSGEPAALEELLASCEADGVRVRRVPVDYASHSVQVERIRGELLEVLAGVVPRSVGVPFYSTVTGGPVDTASLDAGYWYANLRGTVELESVTRALVADGFGVFVEVSPHPVLTMALQETLDAAGAEGVVSGTLRRGEGGPARFLSSAAELFVRGVGVQWSAVFGSGERRLVDLPTYAFDRRRYWLEPVAGEGVPVGADPVEAAFWEAVEREDVRSLAAALDLDGLDPLVSLLPS